MSNQYQYDAAKEFQNLWNTIFKAAMKEEASSASIKMKVREEELANLRERIKELEASLPHPCDGELYDDWSPADFFLKVTEEFGEMTVAFRDWSREAAPRELPKEFHTDEICRTHIHLMEECTDLIIATVGLMERMGADEKSRARYMKEANVSNAKRDGGRRFKHD